jgi:hypothetical protein
MNVFKKYHFGSNISINIIAFKVALENKGYKSSKIRGCIVGKS